MLLRGEIFIHSHHSDTDPMLALVFLVPPLSLNRLCSSNRFPLREAVPLFKVTQLFYGHDLKPKVVLTEIYLCSFSFTLVSTPQPGPTQMLFQVKQLNRRKSDEE